MVDDRTPETDLAAQIALLSAEVERLREVVRDHTALMSCKRREDELERRMDAEERRPATYLAPRRDRHGLRLVAAGESRPGGRAREA